MCRFPDQLTDASFTFGERGPNPSHHLLFLEEIEVLTPGLQGEHFILPQDGGVLWGRGKMDVPGCSFCLLKFLLYI